MYDDESTLVLALLEPIEIALQCLQLKKKKIFVWKSMGTFGAILSLTEIAQKGRYYTERNSTLIGLYFQR